MGFLSIESNVTTTYHEHNCTKCVWLGTDDTDGGGPVDYYFCLGHSLFGMTLIARFSSEPSDCISGVSLYWQDQFINEAGNLAMVSGLLSRQTLEQVKPK